MTTFLLVINLLVTLALIGTILIQRSEGGGLGIGSSQGMGSFMTGRGTATLLTRATSVLAGVFMLLCLVLALLNRGASSGVGGHDILADPPAPAPAPAAATTAPAAPATPAAPAPAETPAETPAH
ncbi:preprotein translocase subunit SecG [Gluconobacter oxydans]|uniref:preprotein translocase subunit SecG n=1 Tax=Gluconobacter thailandicus TaxID=257438 RepID=UPI00029989AC|nr:preprotein translocase subunit SecG [Gluconobacter thailandicus]AFW02265.1 preprotein translocase, SecG subunit [Gluconobacter oxydans H24]ANQ42208.1 preprotein translocase subunit SecG [Gluconobacter oxydans]